MAGMSRTDTNVKRAHRYLAILALALAGFACATSPASAAGSYDNCIGFIDTVPMVVATPGTWCLRKNLATSDPDFSAIDIQTNNVTINCNGFRLQNLATGTGPYSRAVAVGGGSSNVMVRNCTIDGFGYGIWITGSPAGSGYVIESNRFSQSGFVGIRVDGFGSVIRGNIVTSSGG